MGKNFCVRPDDDDDTWIDGEESRSASTWLPVNDCNLDEVGPDEGPLVKINPAPKSQPKQRFKKAVETVKATNKLKKQAAAAAAAREEAAAAKAAQEEAERKKAAEEA